MIPKDYRLFPDPEPEKDKKSVSESDIKEVFIVVYHEDGTEMMSFRKSYVEIKNVNIEEMISLHPSSSFSAIEEETTSSLRKKYIGE